MGNPAHDCRRTWRSSSPQFTRLSSQDHTHSPPLLKVRKLWHMEHLAEIGGLRIRCPGIAGRTPDFLGRTMPPPWGHNRLADGGTSRGHSTRRCTAHRHARHLVHSTKARSAQGARLNAWAGSWSAISTINQATLQPPLALPIQACEPGSPSFLPGTPGTQPKSTRNPLSSLNKNVPGKHRGHAIFTGDTGDKSPVLCRIVKYSEET